MRSDRIAGWATAPRPSSKPTGSRTSPIRHTPLGPNISPGRKTWEHLKREERHELRPRVLPQPHDGWETGLPALGELGEAVQGGCLGGGGVDGLEVFRDGRPVLAAGVAETVGQTVHHRL